MLSLVPGPTDGTAADVPRRAQEDDRGPDLLAPLVDAARTGDPVAVRALVVRVGPLLLKVVRKVMGDHHPDLEDVTQDAAFAVVTSLPTFRGECRTIHFVSRVAALTAMAARRRARYREEWTPAVDPEEAERLGMAPPPQHQELLAERRRAALRYLLDQLPEAQAEVLVMHHVLGAAVAEIADSSGAALNTVRSRLRRAKQALLELIERDQRMRELLGDCGGES